MADIVERLQRDWSCRPITGPLMVDAAAEITRLRTELANARAADVHSCHDGCTRAGCVNARLREALEDIAGTTDGTDCNSRANEALKETK